MYTITGPENHLIYLALKKKTQVLITMKVKLPNYRPQQANKYLCKVIITLNIRLMS